MRVMGSRTPMDGTTLAAPVTLSPRAAAQVNKVLAGEGPGRFLRVAVNGGGCSGFQYTFDIVRDRETDDIVVELNGAVVLIDPVSIEFLSGSRIDFIDDLMGRSFKIENPNATASCGCGTSFAV